RIIHQLMIKLNVLPGGCAVTDPTIECYKLVRIFLSESSYADEKHPNPPYFFHLSPSPHQSFSEKHSHFLFTVGMTIITRLTVILISSNVTMFIIHALLIVFMAENTFEDCIIVGLYMTIGTGIPFILMFSGINGEILPIVIPGDLIPVGGIMTLLTIRGEIRCLMIRLGGVIVIRLMTGITIGRGIGISIRMTIIALQSRVPSRQLEACQIMVKIRRSPGILIMANQAIGGEIPADMVRITD
ncbi:MAG: hypothetical protein D6732_02630, partial [Methanobacteriota archaeon]